MLCFLTWVGSGRQSFIAINLQCAEHHCEGPQKLAPFHQCGMKIPLPHFYVLPIDSPSVQCQNFPTHSFQNLNNSFNPFHDLHDFHKFPQTTLPCSSYKPSWLHDSHPDKLKGLAYIPTIPYLFHATHKTFHAPQSHTIRPSTSATPTARVSQHYNWESECFWFYFKQCISLIAIREFCVDRGVWISPYVFWLSQSIRVCERWGIGIR